MSRRTGTKTGTTMVTARLPNELVQALKDEADKYNEPVTRCILRHLQDYEGWVERDGAWDFHGPRNSYTSSTSGIGSTQK